MINTVSSLVVIRPSYLHIHIACTSKRDSGDVHFITRPLSFTTASLQASLHSRALGLDK